MRQYVQHIIHWTSIIFIQTYTFYSLIPPYYNTLFCCCICSCCWCLNILFFKLNLWFCYFAYFSCRSQTLRLLVRCKNVRRLQTTYFFCFFSLFFASPIKQTASSFVIRYEITDQISSISEQRWYGMIQPWFAFMSRTSCSPHRQNHQGNSNKCCI